MQRRLPLTVLVASLASGLGLVGCGGSTSTSSKRIGSSSTPARPSTLAPTSTSVKSSPSTSFRSSSSSPNGVDPNAPEVVAPGDIPDNQVFVPFTGSGYVVKVPEGWARSESGPEVVFSDRYNTIRIETASAPSAPTVSSVTATVPPQLRTANPGFVLGRVAQVNRSAGPAVLVTYEASSAKDPVTGKSVALDVERYEFWKNGNTVMITLSASKGSDNVDPWKTVTNSFAWQ